MNPQHLLIDAGLFMQTIQPWLTPAVLLAILGVVLRYRLGARKIEIEGEQVRVNLAEAEDGAEAKLRDHYAQELQSLRNQISQQAQRHMDREREIDERWRAAVAAAEKRHADAAAAADKRHEECQRSRDELKLLVEELRNRIRGLERLLTQHGDSALHLIDRGARPSDEIKDAGKRTMEKFDRDPER